LPAEQFAIKNNKDPNIFTQQNIVIMRNQIKQFCGMIDWDFEIDATDPKYYAGTQ
jgi:leucyl-tRNA synthetase